MPTLPKRTCSQEGCDRPVKSRGLCDPHYKQWWRANKAKRCKITGCDRPVSAHGLCGAHDMRRKRYGDPRAFAPRSSWHEDLIGEHWRPVPECPDHYEVSNMGRVRRTAEASPNEEPYVLALNTNGDGYPCVTLFVEGKPRYRGVHRLVARAFLSRPKGRVQVNHRSGIKTDNRVANLEWVTASQNIRHRFRVLKHEPLKGSDHGMAKLTAAQVLAMRSEFAAGGVTYTELAERYGIALSAAHNIINRRRWKHI